MRDECPYCICEVVHEPFFYEEWAIRHPVARKEHQCDYCYGPITIGQKYVRIIGRMDNLDFFSHAAHWRCIYSNEDSND